MSFKFTFAQDITQYGQDVADNSGDPPDDSGGATGLGRITAFQAGAQFGNLLYHIGRDRFFSPFRVSSASQASTGVGFFDPNFIADSPPNADYRNGTTIGIPSVIALIPDQFDPALSAQRIFLANTGFGNIDELNPNALTVTPDVFDGPNGIFRNTASDIGVGVNGGWTSLDERSLFFTGLKDGIRVTTGVTPNDDGDFDNVETLQSGTNVYPDGLFLQSINAGQLEGNNVRDSFVWVDIRTRRMEGLLGAGLDGLSTGVPKFFPREVDATPVGNSSEAPIAGREFLWVAVQYLPDTDATFAEPKGEIVFINRLEIPPVGASPAPGTTQEIYIRIADFNPFNKAAGVGARTRNHGRKRLTSRILLNLNPAFGLAGQDAVENPANPSVQFDPLRSRWVCIVHNALDLDPPPTDTNFSTVGFFSRVVDPVIVTNPAARDVPRTNDIIEFESFVGGDIGEPVGGQSLDWTLDRRSTEGEVLDASTFPGTSTVANPPIDDVSPSIPEGTLVVVADATTLVEGTDYTVVLATGVITWITDQSGATLVTATYEHKSTAATPPHGTLLSNSSTTEEGGKARTQVRYIDDSSLAGTLDQLTSDLS